MAEEKQARLEAVIENAMKGYHYLMRIGHLLNVPALNAVQLAKIISTLGTRGFIRFIRQTLSGPWLDAEQVLHRRPPPEPRRTICASALEHKTFHKGKNCCMLI